MDGFKGAEIRPEKVGFCSGNFVPLFLNRDILNQVCGLTLQKTAERFKVFPRHALLVSELLERGLAQQPLCADFVGVVALFFQGVQDINRA